MRVCTRVCVCVERMSWHLSLLPLGWQHTPDFPKGDCSRSPLTRGTVAPWSSGGSFACIVMSVNRRHHQMSPPPPLLPELATSFTAHASTYMFNNVHTCSLLHIYFTITYTHTKNVTAKTTLQLSPRQSAAGGVKTIFRNCSED